MLPILAQIASASKATSNDMNDVWQKLKELSAEPESPDQQTNTSGGVNGMSQEEIL